MHATLACTYTTNRVHLSSSLGLPATITRASTTSAIQAPAAPSKPSSTFAKTMASAISRCRDLTGFSQQQVRAPHVLARRVVTRATRGPGQGGPVNAGNGGAAGGGRTGGGNNGGGNHGPKKPYRSPEDPNNMDWTPYTTFMYFVAGAYLLARTKWRADMQAKEMKFLNRTESAHSMSLEDWESCMGLDYLAQLPSVMSADGF